MVHERNELDSLFKNRTRTRVEREDDYIDQNMVKQFWSQASCVPVFSFGPWRNQIQVSKAASHITKIHAVHPFRVHVTVVRPSNAVSSASSSGGSSDMPWRRHFWAGAMDKSLHRLERWSCGVVETVVACSPSLFPWKWMMLTVDSTMDLDGRWPMHEWNSSECAYCDTLLRATCTGAWPSCFQEHNHRQSHRVQNSNSKSHDKQTNKQTIEQTNKQSNVLQWDAMRRTIKTSRSSSSTNTKATTPTTRKTTIRIN